MRLNILFIFCLVFLSSDLLVAQCGSSGGIIINEIHYNPVGSTDNEEEFVEIKNTSDATIDIGSWVITDGEFTHTILAGTMLAPGGLYLIENGATQNYSGSNGTFDKNLSNDGEEVMIKDDMGVVIDAVTYNDTNPWDNGSGCNPSGDSDGGGESLQVTNPCLSNSSSDNWTACTPTPGAQNPLEISLTSFKGMYTNGVIELRWVTESEINNDYIEVEKSNDGQNFYSIGRVKGNGTTSSISSYNFMDKSPNKGINFYRLKQFDLDGSYEYFNIINVDSRLANFNISINPNPSSDFLKIHFPSASEELNVEILDIRGRILSQKKYSSYNSEEVELDIRNLNTGNYWIKITSDKFCKTIPMQKL